MSTISTYSVDLLCIHGVVGNTLGQARHLACRVDPHQPQVVHEHVSAESEPEIPKPDHLTLVRYCHGLPRRAQAGDSAHEVIQKKQSLGVSVVGLTDAP